MKRLQEQTAAKPTAEQLRLLSAALAAAANGIIITDREGAIVWVNQAFTRLTGYTFDEVVGANPRVLKSGKHPHSFYRELWQRILSGQVWQGEVINRRKDGSFYTEEMTITPLRDDNGAIANFIGVKQDVTDRKRYEVELEQAKRTAEAATQAKSDFLAAMSHEIRTPMNSIIGMTELALDTDLTALQRHYLETVAASAEALLEVINDILDFSKIEAGKLGLDPREFHLRDMLGETMQALAVRAHKKGLELACRITPDVPDTLVGDAGRLRQIVVNLVGNAVKFTEQGEVVLEVTPERTAHCAAPAAAESAPADGVASSRLDEAECVVHFSVRDTGIGIPEEQFQTIFRRFEQAHRSTFTKYGGTGLGLAISSQLAAMMGGRIWVESQVGHGSTFHFTARFGASAAVSGGVQPQAAADLHDAAVLVADDNAAAGQILAEVLTAWRMRPTVVESGHAALAAAWRAYSTRQPFRVLVADADMPEMSGLVLAEVMRSTPELSGTAIILVAPTQRPPDAARCAELGLTACLTKPAKESDLLAAVVAALSPVPAPTEHSDAERPAREVSPPARRLRILLAEDNELNQMVAVSALEGHGHTVVVVPSGSEALAAVEREPFDLILMDVQMPDMDGFTATAEIRHREREAERGAASPAHIPIIAITAYGSAADRERCLAVGMDAYVSKPVGVHALLEVIDSVMSGADVGDWSTDGQAPAVLDKTAALDHVDGDVALLRELVGNFGPKASRLLADIEAAVTDGDGQALLAAAHALKGAAGLLGAWAVVAAAQRLEVMGYEGNLQRSAEAYAALRADMDQLQTALKTFSDSDGR